MYFDVNGTQVFASSGGKAFDNALPTVIFLHGSGFDHTFWALHSKYFASRNYAVLVPDLPGHSRSEGPALTSIEQMADWLHDIVDSLDIDDLSLVAHSQGCLIALEFSSRRSKNLRSLSLVASGLATPVNPALIAAAEDKPDDAVSMILSWGFSSAGNLHQHPVPGDSVIAECRSVLRGNVTEALVADLKACDAYKNGTSAVANITCPVQVLIAGQDRMAPEKATAELVARLAEPEVHRLPESGHMLPLEAPDECRKLLRSFVFAHNPSN